MPLPHLIRVGFGHFSTIFVRPQSPYQAVSFVRKKIPDWERFVLNCDFFFFFAQTRFSCCLKYFFVLSCFHFRWCNGGKFDFTVRNQNVFLSFESKIHFFSPLIVFCLISRFLVSFTIRLKLYLLLCQMAAWVSAIGMFLRIFFFARVVATFEIHFLYHISAECCVNVGVPRWNWRFLVFFHEEKLCYFIFFHR